MKTRVLTLALALLFIFSGFALADDSQNETTNGASSTKSAIVNYNGIDWINAVEFGLVGDGKTLNDDKMGEYIKNHYQTPIYFPAGVYCFEKSLHFPDNMYIELDPSAELRCVAKETLDFFITVRKDNNSWVQADGYSKSYIKGGTINANYCTKTAIAVCQCYHAQFESFTVKNVQK